MNNLILPGTDTPKVIALDYDRTANTNIEFWQNFVAYAHASNYHVYIVTMRAENEIREVRLNFEGRVKGIITTAYQAKRAYCERKRINVDIWIDDSPEYIITDLGRLMDIHTVQDDDTHMKGFGFFYTDCQYEVPMILRSFHRTKAGAYKAMREFLLKTWEEDWQGYLREKRTHWISSESGNVKYCNSKRTGTWFSPFEHCMWKVKPHTIVIKE